VTDGRAYGTGASSTYRGDGVSVAVSGWYNSEADGGAGAWGKAAAEGANGIVVGAYDDGGTDHYAVWLSWENPAAEPGLPPGLSPAISGCVIDFFDATGPIASSSLPVYRVHVGPSVSAFPIPYSWLPRLGLTQGGDFSGGATSVAVRVTPARIELVRLTYRALAIPPAAPPASRISPSAVSPSFAPVRSLRVTDGGAYGTGAASSTYRGSAVSVPVSGRWDEAAGAWAEAAPDSGAGATNGIAVGAYNDGGADHYAVWLSWEGPAAEPGLPPGLSPAISGCVVDFFDATSTIDSSSLPVYRVHVGPSVSAFPIPYSWLPRLGLAQGGDFSGGATSVAVRVAPGRICKVR
jgi:hypothetical protein